MMQASNVIKTECCGVGLLSVEKADLVGKVQALEKKNQELQNRIDDAISNAALNREKFAHKCFTAGVIAVEFSNRTECCNNKLWLNFKALEL
jgi:hypothetical protein